MPLPAKLGAIFFTLIGVALLVYATSLAPFTTGSDPRVWQEKVPYSNSAVYQKVRKAHLTSKYKFEDYGASCLVVAALCVLAGNARRARTPGSLRTYVLLALGLPCVSWIAYVLSNYQQLLRYAAPHWADSFAVVLVEGVVLAAVGWAVTLLHLFCLRGVSVNDVSLAPGMETLQWRHKSDLWLRVMIGLSYLCLLEAMVAGSHWWIWASVGWIYYFMSLFSLRLPANT